MLIFLFAAMGMAMNAEIIEYTDGDFKYNLDAESETAELSKYRGTAKYVSIPESVTYDSVIYSVTSLGDWCFSSCSSILLIKIPSSVTKMGTGCFNYCSSLTTINIPESVRSLSDHCFYNCN